jgi:hypothetical protein
LSNGTSWEFLDVGFNASYATTISPGIITIATDLEVQTGTDTTKAVVSSSLQSKISDSTTTDSSTTIASSTAVKAAYDVAVEGISKSIITSKGDLIAGSGTGTVVSIPVGSDGQSLYADSSETGGVAWNDFFFDTYANLPSTGLDNVLYVVEDTDTIYRGVIGPASYDFTVGPTGDFPDLPTALADPAVTNGTTLSVQAGTYTLTSTLAINKQVQLFGEDKNTVILQSAATTSAPTTLISVTVDNVVLKGLTISHRKTSNTSIEAAVFVSGPGSPPTRVDNFILDDCIIRHIEFGVVVRGSNWKLSNSSYVYAGPNNSTRYHVGIYGVSGDCFAVGNTSNEDVAPGTTGSTRWFSMLSTTGTNPNETYVGTMVVEGNTQVGGTLQQFINQGAWQGSAGQYNLIVKGNTTTNDSSAFVVFSGGVANFGDILGEVTVEGNSLANTGGKGVIGLDASSLISFRSSPLTVHVPTPNTLSSTTWASNWAEAPGSSDNTVGYRTTTISPPSIAQDTVAPTIPPEPVTPGPSSSFVYVPLPGSASTTIPGIVQLATDLEVQTGTDTTKAVVSSSLQSKISDSVSTTSSTTIASSTAVKAAYDAGVQGQTDAAAAQATADAAVPDASFTASGDLLVGTGAGTYAALPAGAADYLLASDGLGGLSWVQQSEGDVTGVTGTAPITVNNTDPQNPVIGVSVATPVTTGTVLGCTASVATGLGCCALASNTSATATNTAVGAFALSTVTTSTGNTAVGSCALRLATGTFGTAVGFNAGTCVTTGVANTLIGATAGDALTTGAGNTAVGFGALGAATTVSNSTAVGNGALTAVTTGAANAALGTNAGVALTTGGFNVLLGNFLASCLTTGSCNIVIGNAALTTSTASNNTIAIGVCSLRNSTGNNNIGIGVCSGFNITTGSNNTIVGPFFGTATLSNNVVLADGAGNAKLQINENGAVGVGTTPDFGTAGQTLQSAGTAGAPTWVSGATGSFTSQDGKTVTVTNGLITSIV